MYLGILCLYVSKAYSQIFEMLCLIRFLLGCIQIFRIWNHFIDTASWFKIFQNPSTFSQICIVHLSFSSVYYNLKGESVETNFSPFLYLLQSESTKGGNVMNKDFCIRIINKVCSECLIKQCKLSCRSSSVKERNL